MKQPLPALLFLIALVLGVSGFYAVPRIQELWRARQLVNAAAGEPDPETARAERQAPLFDVAPVLVPSSVPYAEPAPDHPGPVVDRAALRSLLLHQKYVALNAAFDAYQGAFEENHALESLPLDASDTFSVAEAPLTGVLDAWVAATPEHFAPYLARGAHLGQLAHARRGGRWIKDTPATDIEAMNAMIPRARADLDHALALRPKLVAAYRERLFLHRLHGEDAASRADFVSARAICSSCLRIAVTYVYTLEPRWGGSYAAMHGFATEQEALGVPGARVLHGFVAVDETNVLLAAEQFDEALTAIGNAFRFGEHADFYAARSDVEYAQKRHAAALADVDRALALRPQQPALEVDRARILIATKEFEKAGRQLLHALRLDANASGARSLRDFVVEHLVYEGWESHRAGDRDRALRLLELAAELSPGNTDVTRRHGWAVIGLDGGAPAAAGAPTADDFHAVQQRDYELSRTGRFADILPLWDHYLAEHPGDARAFLERGGTHFHLGHGAEARADATRACALGSNEGCLRARQMQ